MRFAVLLIVAAIATPVLAQAPHHLPGEEAVDPYVAGNANAGPRGITDPAVLAFTQGAYGTDYPSVNYATVYPLSMFMRVLVAQLLILLAIA